MLPGWQLSITIVDTRLMEEAARSRMATYLWVGYLVIGMMAITGLVAGQSFRKQMRLARLKTDLVASGFARVEDPACIDAAAGGFAAGGRRVRSEEDPRISATDRGRKSCG